jgi:hypothetical protein
VKEIIRKRDKPAKPVSIPPSLEKLRLLNEKQVAELTKVSVGKLRNDRNLKRGLPFVRVGGAIRYKVEDVRSYEEANRVETT